MTSRNLVAAIAVVILIILAGGFFYLKNNSSTPSPTPTPVTVAPTSSPTEAMPSSSPSASASPSSAMKEASVSLTANGFVPQTLNINVGEKVTWTNNSGNAGTVNSDPHPTHTFWPFLNLNGFEDGQTLSVSFDKAGTYTYHNHLHPSQKGTIVVK